MSDPANSTTTRPVTEHRSSERRRSKHLRPVNRPRLALWVAATCAGLIATTALSAGPGASVPSSSSNTAGTGAIADVASTAAPAAGAPGTVSPHMIGPVRATGMSQIIDVSKNGRIALGMLNGVYVVRDIVRNRTLRRLPTTDAHAYYAISDSGRYVAYSWSRDAASGVCFSPWVRDRITNRARPAATLPSGAALRPGWDPPAGCPDEPSWRTNATFSQPALSGNGRYVAFCANLAVPDRLDLYRKDLRTRRLVVVTGACSEGRSAFEWPMPPQISETGRVTLAPGAHTGGDEAGPVSWQPANLLASGILSTGVIGGWPALTDDGSAVFSVSPAACPAGFGACAAGPVRYHVPSGVVTPLAAGDPGPGPMSRRGRYTLGYILGLTDVPADNHLSVYDRTLAVSTDLTANLVAAGVTIPTNHDRINIPGDGSRPPALISGDGRVVLVLSPTEDRWYAVTWM